MKRLIVINWKFDPIREGQNLIFTYSKKILSKGREEFFSWLTTEPLAILPIYPDEDGKSCGVLPINFDFSALDYIEENDQRESFEKLIKRIEETAIAYFETKNIEYQFFQHVEHGFSKIWRIKKDEPNNEGAEPSRADSEKEIKGKLIKFEGGYDFLYSEWGLIAGDFPAFSHHAFLREQGHIDKEYFEAVWYHYQSGTLLKLKHMRTILETLALGDEGMPKARVDKLLLNFLIALDPEPEDEDFQDYINNKREELKRENFYPIAIQASPILSKDIKDSAKIDQQAMIYNFSSSKDINPKLAHMQKQADESQPLKEKLIQAMLACLWTEDIKANIQPLLTSLNQFIVRWNQANI